MIVVNVKADISEMLKDVDAIRREQAPFATALALTRTAQYVKGQLTDEMDTAFDRPTPFTKNALFVKPAKKAELTASVKVKDEAAKGNPAVKWLFPEIYGGSRNLKGFEALLMRAGVLTRGYFAIPAAAAPMDAYGNVPGSAITAILSQLQASRDYLTNEPHAKGVKRNRTRQQGRYFAVIPGRPAHNHLPPGIYERIGTTRHAKVMPVFIFTSKEPRYRARYNFMGLGEQWARARFPTELRTAFDVAVKTAR